MYQNHQEEKRLKALKSSYTTNFDNMKNQFQEITRRVKDATQRYIEMAKKSMSIKYAHYQRASQINKDLYKSSNEEEKQEIAQIQVK